jgi:hypothetical protein
VTAVPGSEDSPGIDRFIHEVGAIYRQGGSPGTFVVDTSVIDDPNTHLEGVEPTAGEVRLEGSGGETYRTVGRVGEHDSLRFTLRRKRAIVSIGGDDIARVFNPEGTEAPDAGPEPLAAAPTNTAAADDSLTPSGEPEVDEVDLGGDSGGTSGSSVGVTSTPSGNGIDFGRLGAGAVLAAVVGLAALIIGGN